MKLNHGYVMKFDKIYKPRAYANSDYYYAIRHANDWIVKKRGVKIKKIDFDNPNDIADELYTANSAIIAQKSYY